MMARSIFTALFCILLTGCSSAYYSALEKVGVHKRDLLVKRVEAARESQAKASTQFQTALEQFRSVVSVPGGKLEEKYNKLKTELDRSETKAKEVRDRITAIENVSEALFDEWKAELEQYENENLRRLSAEQLERSKDRYGNMIKAMKKAEGKIEPVLKPFRDNVLFLKHNLNAKAIGSLDSEVSKISDNVEVLIRNLEVAMSEADEFISVMKAGRED
ncbi:MAG: DUF2959 domain-containing protein [SAR324 cluster bacterium]|uniref:DUF2959 domain-containing protein n=1 Tax=SAR324 cluster bacterium TaxID=2024889 RepID=A0A7X9FQV5_9DELT|nr:DUF2959 domain-containing protein [SAR324 cluster bacterium]